MFLLLIQSLFFLEQTVLMVHPRIFFANVEIDGQRYDILCKNDCLFSKLIVLITSTSKISSVFSLLYISFIEWIAASIPASYPTQIFTGLGVFITCSFNRETMTLPVIRFKTSRTSNGLSFTNSSAFYQQIELKLSPKRSRHFQKKNLFIL